MLNRALQLMNVDLIIKMGFFIDNLHPHIEQLHKEQFNGNNSSKSFTVYRGQGISKEDFEQMTKTKGGLISFNSFLSTSKNRNISLGFAHGAAINPDLVGILFVMIVDPAKSTTSFASITDVSYYGDKEDEVLFSMHTVFRIGDTQPMSENDRLFRVDLTLTSDNDKDLRVLTDHIREETYPNEEGWFRLGRLLLQMGQSGKAQQVYEILLRQTTDESEKGRIYHLFGWAKDVQGEYTEAITIYEKALEIHKKTHSSTDLSLASSYNNIGLVYKNMGKYSKALSYYEKTLAIQQQSLPPNHPDLTMFHYNISLIYDNLSNYSEALSSCERAVNIAQQSLPSNHPDLQDYKNNLNRIKKKL